MATYQVTMPGGNVISQDLPDGMSDQMVKAAFLKHYQAAGFSSVGNIVDQSPQSQAPTPDIAPQAPDVPPPGTPNPLGYYQGEIRPYTPSLSETIQNKLAGYATPIMGDMWGNKLAQAATEGLNTFTPMGALTAANDAGRAYGQAQNTGSWMGKLGGIADLLGTLAPIGHGIVHTGAMAGMVGHLLQDEQGTIRAWHGSPHDFDAFDTSKIGTGEGAQAYGHGLYFAENKDVAQGYQDQVKNMGAVRDINARMSDISKQLDPLTISYGKYRTPEGYQLKAEYNALMDQRAQVTSSPGHLYEVNINAHPDHFLDWDAPLSEQGAVSQKLSSAGLPVYRDNRWYGPNKPSQGPTYWTNNGSFVRQSGNQFEYGHGSPWDSPALGSTNSLEAAQAQTPVQRTPLTALELFSTGSQEQMQARASALSQAGIPGIKYLDEGSRGAGNGTHNYVVFDPSKISILAKH